MKYNLEYTFKDLGIRNDQLSDLDKNNLINNGYTVIKFSPEEWKKEE